MVINADELVFETHESVWAKYNTCDEFEVVCPAFPESGTRKYSGTQIIITWYGLRFIRGIKELVPLYPHAADIATPKARHEYFYSEPYFNPDVQLKWMNVIFWQVWEDIGGALYPEELSYLVDVIVNDIYNMHVSDISEYIGTMSILDDIEIINDPRALKSHAENGPSPEGVENIQNAHIDILDDKDGELSHNRLVRVWKAGLPKRQQTIQKVGIIGYRTEGDSSIIPTPIMGSYTGGMDNLRDVAVESCSSKKAQIMTTDPVADSEYFGRRLQLLVAYVRVLSRSTGRTTKLHDCGNHRTLSYTVGRHDLPNLAGVFTEDKDGSEHEIQETDTHYIGRTIQIRSPAVCGLRHKGEVCGKCMGGIAWSIDPRASLGHQSVIEIIEPIVQSVISTKHEDKSATGGDITVPDKFRTELMLTADRKGIRLTDKLKEGWDIIIPHKALPIPSDLYIPGAVKKIKALNFSEVKYIWLRCRKTRVTRRINVAIRKTPAYLSSAFLEFMSHKTFTMDENSNYVVELDGFNVSNALLRYPVKHRNTLDFMNDFASMIESKGDRKDQSYFSKKMTDFDTVDEALQELAELVYSRFQVNISHLGVVLLAILCRSKDDASIPRIDEPGVFLPRDDLFDGRSVMSRFSFQGQTGLMKKPRAYTVKNRMPVAMDIILR